ncbi:MAG: aminodeoxychorismate/anthranilate synthase component II [Pseudomonadota bacterium]
MILIIDNYDSFVHTLARYAREEGFAVEVVRNDALTLAEVEQAPPSAMVFSPGPGRPEEAGISIDLMRRFGAEIPMLGVCLGHQCMIAAAGGTVERARTPMHGQASLIRHDGQGVFRGLPNPAPMGRYHSLIGAPPPDAALQACAWSEDGEVMGVRRQDWPHHGVQFHPESVLSPDGRRLLQNFLLASEAQRAA